MQQESVGSFRPGESSPSSLASFTGAPIAKNDEKTSGLLPASWFFGGHMKVRPFGQEESLQELQDVRGCRRRSVYVHLARKPAATSSVRVEVSTHGATHSRYQPQSPPMNTQLWGRASTNIYRGVGMICLRRRPPPCMAAGVNPATTGEGSHRTKGQQRRSPLAIARVFFAVGGRSLRPRSVR